MKNVGYEARLARRWKSSRKQNRLTRAGVVKAFAHPSITRLEAIEIVKRYMGDSPVPPAWSYASIRGVFGKKVARIWAKRLRHRLPGVYRDSKSGRWLHPVTQTAYDFGTTPEKLRAMSEMVSKSVGNINLPL